MRLLLPCLLLLTALRAAPTAAQQRALDGSYARIVRADDRLGAREIARYIQEAVSAGEQPAKVAKAIETLRTQQELRPDHPDFGNFRWYRGQPEVKDRNAVQFVNSSLLALMLGEPSKLDPANAQSLRTLLTDSARGSRGQKVKPEYTNIFLMKSVNLVLAGQALGQPELTEEGRRLLREWLAWTKVNGVTEFNSTTYTGVDMDSAIQLLRLAKDPRDQETGRTLLRLFWTEVAANWFEPAQRLGGAHSRDYNYLQGIGSTDVQLADNGWIPPLKPDPLAAEGESRRWIAPKEWTDGLRRQMPREVVQRWLAGPGSVATQWITPLYSIGTGGTSKAFDDKMFAVQFAGDRRDPMVYFTMESRDDPYGIAKEPDSNGHSKALHLRPSLVTAQNKDRVLLLAAENTERPKHPRPVPELKGLWSHVVFPSEARLCDAAGDDLKPGPLPGEYAYVRKAGVTLALHFVAASRLWSLGSEPRLPVRYVRDGDKVRAARLTVEHATGPHPGMGLLAFTAETAPTPDDAAFRAFAQRFEARRDSLSVFKNAVADFRMGLGTPTELGASLDLTKNKVLKVTGTAPFAPTDILRVNGEDPWTPLLDVALAR